MKRCVQCGKSRLRQGRTNYDVRVGKETVRVEIPALECGDCGESYTEGADMERAELSVARELARGGQVTGPAFRFMRHALGLQGKELAELLGTPAETISRWETGAREPDRYAWLTLAAIVTDEAEGRSAMRDMLAATRSPSPMPERVAFQVAGPRGR